MTERDAINKILRYVGELPTPSDVIIDDLPDGHEAKTAKTILEETNRETQERGWWFNTEEWTFVPSDNYITIPNNVIYVKSTNATDKYLVKGNSLYDAVNQTKRFDRNVTLWTVFEEQFGEVPDIFANYIVYVASKYLHTFLNGDDGVQKELEKLIYNSYIKLDREDMSYKDYNLIKGTKLIDRDSNPTTIT